jgi:hypothetical protein
MLDDGTLFGYHVSDDRWNNISFQESSYMACDGISTIRYQLGIKSKPRVMLVFGDNEWRTAGLGGWNRMKALCKTPTITYQFQRKTLKQTNDAFKSGADLVVYKKYGASDLVVNEYPQTLCSNKSLNITAWELNSTNTY